jgi:hypothetical protein
MHTPRFQEKSRTLACNPAGALYAPGKPSSKARLKLLSAKANGITDTDAWLAKHAIPVNRTRPEEVAMMVAESKFVFLTPGEPYFVGVYGQTMKTGTLATLFDQSEAGLSMKEILDFSRWKQGGKSLNLFAAVVEKNMLYVIASSSDYADTNKGLTGYLAAISLKTGKVVWQAGPRVANCTNMILHRDFLICGYGYTREPDFLFVIDKKTGRTLQKIPLKSAPEELALDENNQLHVRCYNTDYVFQLTGIGE